MGTVVHHRRLHPDHHRPHHVRPWTRRTSCAGGNTVPDGELAGVVEEVLDGVAGAKIGRPIGHTTEAVTAVELDGWRTSGGSSRSTWREDLGLRRSLPPTVDGVRVDVAVVGPVASTD